MNNTTILKHWLIVAVVSGILANINYVIATQVNFTDSKSNFVLFIWSFVDYNNNWTIQTTYNRWQSYIDPTWNSFSDIIRS